MGGEGGFVSALNVVLVGVPGPRYVADVELFAYLHHPIPVPATHSQSGNTRAEVRLKRNSAAHGALRIDRTWQMNADPQPAQRRVEQLDVGAM